MKRNLFVYIGLPICAAIFLAFGIVVLVLDSEPREIVGGVILLAAAVFVLLVLAKIVMQDNLNLKCGKLCEEKKYDEERALIEKKMKSPLFFLIRPSHSRAMSASTWPSTTCRRPSAMSTVSVTAAASAGST